MSSIVEYTVTPYLIYLSKLCASILLFWFEEHTTAMLFVLDIIAVYIYSSYNKQHRGTYISISL